MPNFRNAIAAAGQRRANRERSASLSTVPPAESSEDYLPELAAVAASILYKSPLPSLEGRPVYILNAAAFPDAYEVDYDSLLAYVLARLPGEDELISGTDYEIVFFAGGSPDNATAEKKQGPSTGWYLQAYHVLGRVTRKKLQRLYIVHPRTWVRVLISVFGTFVSPKFRRKIVHVNSLSQLALHLPIENMLIPPSAYLHDRKISPDIYAPFVTGRRAFGARHPLPKNLDTGKTRLPRVLRETTSFILLPSNIKTEGLFRIPPHSILSGILKEAYDRGQQFIVWKEKGAVLVQPGMPHDLVDEVRLEDAYGVHLAASLIKTWYRELREPIFPESSYAQLRERYADPSVKVTPEELVDMLYPASTTSTLTQTAREILTRHLLPLLSAVAAHESSNKMNSENLAILFSMCLVCGSNQMEDGKMSTITKRILQAAIEMWSELRSGMGIDATAFLTDLEAPPDQRDYEDPLEEKKPPKPLPEADEDEQEVGHRIDMKEDGSPVISPEGLKPALPPRRSRAASLKKALTPNMSNINMPNIDLPSLPKIELPSLPKRKPAPHHVDPPSPQADSATSRPTSMNAEPPRYSTMFDADGRSILGPETTAADVPANGFAPPRRADFSFQGDEKKTVPPYSADFNPMATVPKRKAVVGSHNSSPEGTKAEPTPEISRKTSETNALLARMAAQQAANNLAHRITVEPPPADTVLSSDNSTLTTSPAVINSAPAEMSTAKTPNDSTFRKPSWPASATRQTKIESFARPVHAQTVPIITHDSRALQTPSMPKPRAPSPGLLKRMTSMESNVNNPGGNDGKTLRPNKLNLRKTSVDDLRRLYEERASTAHNLVELGRRSTNGQ